jgi:hypothetical protein
MSIQYGIVSRIGMMPKRPGPLRAKLDEPQDQRAIPGGRDANRGGHYRCDHHGDDADRDAPDRCDAMRLKQERECDADPEDREEDRVENKLFCIAVHL